MGTEKSLSEVARTRGAIAALRQAVKSADAAITGALGTSREQFFMLPGRLVQAMRNGSFLEQLFAEYEDLVERGKIKPDYDQTEQGVSCLQELLAALEDPPVDHSRFRLLKQLFLSIAMEHQSDREDPTPQLLMGIARGLTTGEILVLAETYRISQDPKAVGRIGGAAKSWIKEIAEGSAVRFEGLVEHYEEKLMERHLLSGRMHSDRSGVRPGQHFRLTDLGLRLCELLATGPEIRESGRGVPRRGGHSWSVTKSGGSGSVAS